MEARADHLRQSDAVSLKRALVERDELYKQLEETKHRLEARESDAAQVAKEHEAQQSEYRKLQMEHREVLARSRRLQEVVEQQTKSIEEVEERARVAEERHEEARRQCMSAMERHKVSARGSRAWSSFPQQHGSHILRAVPPRAQMLLDQEREAGMQLRSALERDSEALQAQHHETVARARKRLREYKKRLLRSHEKYESAKGIVRALQQDRENQRQVHQEEVAALVARLKEVGRRASLALGCSGRACLTLLSAPVLEDARAGAAVWGVSSQGRQRDRGGGLAGGGDAPAGGAAVPHLALGHAGCDSRPCLAAEGGA